MTTDKNNPVTEKDFADMMTAIQKNFNSIEERMATKEDLAQLKTELEGKLASKDDLKELAKEVARSMRISESILKVVESMEGQVRENRDHGPRIERLEVEVLKLKTRQ